jgi:adenylate cyclase
MKAASMKKSIEFNDVWEEERIFLFIDLNDSTFLAEKLGNKLFSYLITQCVADLYPLIHQYKASLYQIVGDEIVLCWAKQDCCDNADILNLFFDFSDKLLLRSSIYKEEFGHAPTFKATGNIGKVAVSSSFNSNEPIYRGDVLNTCGGLLSLCKTLNKPLIVTESFINSLGTNHASVNVQPIGRYLVKGKSKHENIFSITRY